MKSAARGKQVGVVICFNSMDYSGEGQWLIVKFLLSLIFKTILKSPRTNRGLYGGSL